MSQQINLFNPIFLKQKKVFSAKAMAEALGVLLAGGLALVMYGQQRVAVLEKDAAAAKAQLVLKEARQAMVNAEFAPRQPSRELETQIAQAEAQLRALHAVAGVLQRGELGNKTGYADYFKAFARQNVDGLWLTGVSIAGAGTDIGVRGRALEPTLIPGYIKRLTRESVLQGKSFASLNISQPQLKGADGATEPPAAVPFVEFSLQSGMPEESR